VVKKLQSHVDELQSQLNSQKHAIVNSIRASYAAAEAREQLMAAEMKGTTKELGQMARYTALKKEVQTDVDLYNSLYAKIKEAGIAAASKSANIRLVDPAMVPDSPKSPRRMLNLAVGLPIGYALLTWCWRVARPFGAVFVPLGQQSLAAFIIQVYIVLLVEQLPLFQANDFWINTVAQIVMLVSIAALLTGAQRMRAFMASGGGKGSVRLPRDPVFGFPTPSGLLPRPAEPAQPLPELS